MGGFYVPPKDHIHPSKDTQFRQAFYGALQKNPPRLSKEGYIRALELYGREDNLFDCLKSSVTRFELWRKNNPGDLESYRCYATARGYDWENGCVDNNSYYTSHNQPENTEIAQENPIIPPTPLPSQAPWADFIEPQEASSSELERMSARDPQGRFINMKRQQQNKTPTRPTRSQGTPLRPASSRTGRNRREPIVVQDEQRPYLLEGAIGNMVWKEGEIAANAAGVAYIATAAMNALRHVVQNDERIEGKDLEIAQELVNYLDADDMNQFRIELGNVVRGEASSGGLRNSWLENEQEESPHPAQRQLFPTTTNPARKRKAPLLLELEAETDSDADNGAIPRGHAREPAELPYILEDCWEIAGQNVQVSVLYADGQAIPLQDTDVAKLLGKFHETVIKEGKINVTLAKSMGMLGIPAAAIIHTDPPVPYLTGEGTVKVLDVLGKCTELTTRSTAKKLIRSAAEFYHSHGYNQLSKRMPALFKFTGTLTYAPSKFLQNRLTVNGQAAFNTPDEEGNIPVRGIGKPDEDEEDDDGNGPS